MCSYDEGEPASVFQQSTPRARKTYRCEECGAGIVPGERYEYVFGVWEGAAFTYRTCLDCVAVIDAWRKVSMAVCREGPSYEFGRAGAAFREFVSEHVKMIEMLGGAHG